MEGRAFNRALAVILAGALTLLAIGNASASGSWDRHVDPGPVKIKIK